MSHYSLEQLISHRPPMILLSRFVAADTTSACCEVDIVSSSLLFQPELQGVPAYAGLEYMAQTIACYAGAQALANGADVKIGFLLGSRKYEPSVPVFSYGWTLRVTAEKVVMEESGLSVFACQIFHQDQLLVQANINVFQPDNVSEWLKE
ncbi:MAG: 3-hydroxylacyl-ACP dehydratase [Rheinheimera sp.]|nr:MAG: 3-hydroxylacyl-ACP dehydratase [Rheinheimera sp.]